MIKIWRVTRPICKSPAGGRTLVNLRVWRCLASSHAAAMACSEPAWKVGARSQSPGFMKSQFVSIMSYSYFYWTCNAFTREQDLQINPEVTLYCDPCPPYVTPGGGPQSLNMICRVSTDHKSRKEGAIFTLQTKPRSQMTLPVSYLPQTGVSMCPRQMSPQVSCPLTLSVKDKPHTPHTISSRPDCFILSQCERSDGERGTAAVTSQQQGHFSSRSKAATAVQRTHVWSNPPQKPQSLIAAICLLAGGHRGNRCGKGNIREKAQLVVSSHIFHLERDGWVACRW